MYCIVIAHDSVFKIVWNTFVNILYTFSFYLIPLVIASNMSLLESLFLVEIVMDIVMFIDVILIFITSYKEDIHEVTNLRLIAVKYMSSYFIFDFLSIVPGLATYESVKPVYFLKLFRY